MKRILLFALACIVSASAVPADTVGPTYLYKGSSSFKVTPPSAAASVAASFDGCQQYAEPLPIVGLNCRSTTVRQIIPKHAPDSQIVSCPSGSTGSWTQTRTYSIVNGAWVAGAWAPASAPTGACTTQIPPKPADLTRAQACPAGSTGSYTQTQGWVYDAASNTWKADTWTPTTPPTGACTSTPVGNLPAIDKAKIPAAVAGQTTPRVQTAPGPFCTGCPQAPSANDIGAFRLTATFARMLFDDPIVFHGLPGASHLHTFVCNDSVDANSTTESIVAVGGSTCAGGTLNKSAYWFPAMIDTANGTPLAPISFLVYYKTGYGGVKPADVKAVPNGLRMIAGSAAGTPTSGTSASRFACIGGTDNIGWQSAIPATCGNNTELMMEVSFPQCWDGVNLDSPDHKSHMAETTGSGCPSTHPVALPKIDYEIHYNATAVAARMAKWRLASDNYASTSPGGYSGHGDYLMGWDAPTMEKIMKNCDNPSIDCHTNLLGDGTWMY